MVSDETAGVLFSVGIGVVVTIIFAALFELLRRVLPRVYELRKELQRIRLKDVNGRVVWAPPEYRLGRWPLSWLWAAHEINEGDIARFVSLDAFVYLRSLRSQFLLFGLSFLLTATVLIPTYATGSRKNRSPVDPLYAEGLNIISMSNLDERDGRLWVTLVIEVILAVLIFFVFYKDYSRYTYYKRKYLASMRPNSFCVLVRCVPEWFKDTNHIFQFFERIFPGEIVYAVHAKYSKQLVSLQLQFNKAVTAKEKFIWQTIKGKPKKVPIEIKVADADSTGLCPQKVSTPAIDHWYERQGALWSDIHSLQQDTDARAEIVVPTNFALIVFKTRHAASQIIQSQLWFEAGAFIPERAPEPHAIVWKKLAQSDWSNILFSTIAVVAITCLIIFWSAIALMVSALGNLSSLSMTAAFSWLSVVNTWPTWVVGLIEGFLPPLIMAILSAVFPVIAKVFLSLGRAYDILALERQVRNCLFIFLYITSFWAILVSGSILSQLNAIVSTGSVTSTVQLLSQSVPAQAIYFLNYVLQAALIRAPQVLLQEVRLFLRGTLWVLLRPKTERQKRALDRGPHSFFLFWKLYAVGECVALMSLVYGTIAPLMNLFATAYFLVAYYVSKYNLCFTHYRAFQDGGNMFRGHFWCLMTCLFTKQAIMAALFGIFKAPVQAVLEGFLLIFSIMLAIIISDRFDRVAKFGSLVSVYDSYGHTIDKDDEVPLPYVTEYFDPGLRPLKHPKNLSGCSEAEITAAGLLQFIQPTTGKDEELAPSPLKQ
ncbi:CSC1-like protein [Porphyridium purpureum]|uniref:CSC1-like protein n=1 Tax=Porphyridium purpureum TaxID=35688 RepID=A0A5J4YWA7_PORPP|nr:CSC1-like protein [Porphyridium purpureum]|eukprot:POR5215..scf209_3